MTFGIRRSILFGAQIGVTALLIWLALGHVDFAAFESLILQPRLEGLLLLLVAFVAQLGIICARWILVLRSLGHRIGAAAACRIVLLSLCVHQALATNIAGDAARIWLLKRSGISLGPSATAVIVDRLTALLGMLILIALTAPMLRVELAAAGTLEAEALQWTILLIVLAGIAGFLFVQASRWFRLGWLPVRLAAPMEGLLASLRVVWCRPRPAFIVIAVTVAGHLLTAVMVYLIARSFAIDVGLLFCLMVVPPVALLATLPISVAGWGVREFGMVSVAAMLGVAGTDALLLSIGLGLLQFLQGALGGLVWLFGPRDRKVRRDGASEEGA